MKPYVGQAAEWDERRNTSRTFPPAPDALPVALAALRAAARTPEGLWVVKRTRGAHDHGARQKNGSRAACPVWGCRAVEALIVEESRSGMIRPP